MKEGAVFVENKLEILFAVRHPPVRRSASSVSSSREHDVHEHFRRSLSGKWPRRSKVDDEKTRASPITRRTSFNNHGSSNCTQQPHVIVSNSGIDIVDHFRRALSEKDFENWQRKRKRHLTNFKITR
ncbi:hypothetical protein COOONC_19032 [Cooperia oncophora]